MYKVLVVGCGNIGAQYDKCTDDIQTHVKAWYLHPEATVYIYDLDKVTANEISGLYNCQIVNDLSIEILSDFDCVSICTPTNTHLELLEKTLAAGVNTVICEKPISMDSEQLTWIKANYSKSSSKVLVNYIRRFLPSFTTLKEFIGGLTEERITNVSIRYQRGFINNCSHAFDLIEFLTGEELILDEIKIGNKVFDHFEYDPTLSLQAKWNDVNIDVLGISNVLFSHFEIDLYFLRYKIVIKNAGDLIEIYEAPSSKEILKSLILKSELTENNSLKDHMKYVIEEAIQMIKGTKNQDNFLSSIALNQRMLKYII